MKMAIVKDPCRVVTGKARSTYMYVNDMRQRGDEITPETPKTAATCVLIPKRDRDTVGNIKRAIKAASKKKFGKVVVFEGDDGWPLHDGDKALRSGKKTGKEYKNHYYLNTRNYKGIPGLVDQDRVAVEDPEEREEICVSGNYFKFSLTFKGFERSGKKVRVEVNNLMFLDEGERLDGGVDAKDEEWGSQGYARDDEYEEEEDNFDEEEEEYDPEDDEEEEEDDGGRSARRSAREGRSSRSSRGRDRESGTRERRPSRSREERPRRTSRR